MRYLPGIVLFLALAGLSHAQIVTVTSDSAEMRSDASTVGTIVLLKAPRYYPLSVRGESGDFLQVRDYLGRSGWVQKSSVGDTKGVVIEVNRANIRTGPGTNYPIAFRALKGVTFKVLQEKDGWLQLQHESGKKGWVSKPLTWGQ